MHEQLYLRVSFEICRGPNDPMYIIITHCIKCLSIEDLLNLVSGIMFSRVFVKERLYYYYQYVYNEIVLNICPLCKLYNEIHCIQSVLYYYSLLRIVYILYDRLKVCQCKIY